VFRNATNWLGNPHCKNRNFLLQKLSRMPCRQAVRNAATNRRLPPSRSSDIWWRSAAGTGRGCWASLIRRESTGRSTRLGRQEALLRLEQWAEEAGVALQLPSLTSVVLKTQSVPRSKHTPSQL